MVEEAASGESAGKSFRERDEEGFRESEVTSDDFYLLRCFSVVWFLQVCFHEKRCFEE